MASKHYFHVHISAIPLPFTLTPRPLQPQIRMLSLLILITTPHTPTPFPPLLHHRLCNLNTPLLKQSPMLIHCQRIRLTRWHREPGISLTHVHETGRADAHEPAPLDHIHINRPAHIRHRAPQPRKQVWPRIRIGDPQRVHVRRARGCLGHEHEFLARCMCMRVYLRRW
jgi:hypothetical protein